jgi:Zn-finger nucleic acid-binding protein
MPASQESRTNSVSFIALEYTMSTAPACPSCRSTTAPRDWLDLFGYECTKCSGLWIPGVTFAGFLSLHSRTPRHAELLDRANRSEPSRRALQCPTCHTSSLHTLGAVGVELDMCGTCGGSYLDGDEVKAFVNTGRAKGWSTANTLITLLVALP